MKKSILLRAALTGLIIASTSATEAVRAEANLGECHGVNSCKGKSECSGKANSCSGKNTCKGKGWIKLTNKDCKAKHGTFKPTKKMLDMISI